MIERVLNIWQSIRSSLWFLPALLILTGLVGANFMLMLDAPRFSQQDAPSWWLHNGSAQDAQNLLSTLLSSLVTMTTLAISITMVVLSIAASQMGPRLIRAFIADRRIQAILGFFLGTIVYLLLVLQAISGDWKTDQVPDLAVSLGALLFLFCVLLLLIFVHQLSRSIVADTIIRRVGGTFDATIAHLISHEKHKKTQTPVPPSFEGATELPLDKGGYVQTINHEKMVAALKHADACAELTFRPGHHVLPKGAHIRIVPAENASIRLHQHLREAVVTGDERTPTQDLEFAARQLVDVALRGLSSSINDPNTAIAAIDRLTLSLARIMAYGANSETYHDSKGTPRLVIPVSDFASILGTAFDQIRQDGAERPDILIRMLEALIKLSVYIRLPVHRDRMLAQAAMLVGAGRRNVAEGRDRGQIERRYAQAVAAIETAALEAGLSSAPPPQDTR
ncbi:DUF2254 domain-containing protein [Fodinicurvata fenggangensis]|uniref:DUF2254 domain-containing protein n=1 Tax=Fodinicurvata fenggangensis TaxID=1121830 RepID=UPI00068ED046|nr:DUF2254 domain-containing protein [Fodinicurvata fenggangensis]